MVGWHKCGVCDKSFSNSSDLSVHVQSHSGEWVFECSICNAMSMSKQSHVSHVKKTHAYLFSDANLDLIHGVLDKFLQEHKAEQEIGGTHRPDMDLLVNGSNNDDLIVRRFRCAICELIFVKKSSLEIHYRRNHPKLPETVNDVFECDICPPVTVFSSSEDFAAHLHQLHGAKNPYKCGQCDDEPTFAHEWYLERHIEMAHFENGVTVDPLSTPSAESYLCSKCPKEFVDPEQREKHEKLHILKRPFSCDVCEKTFIHASSLAKHKLSHTGKRPFMCDLCGKSFLVS